MQTAEAFRTPKVERAFKQMVKQLDMRILKSKMIPYPIECLLGWQDTIMVFNQRGLRFFIGSLCFAWVCPLYAGWLILLERRTAPRCIRQSEGGKGRGKRLQQEVSSLCVSISCFTRILKPARCQRPQQTPR